MIHANSVSAVDISTCIIQKKNFAGFVPLTSLKVHSTPQLFMPFPIWSSNSCWSFFLFNLYVILFRTIINNKISYFILHTFYGTHLFCYTFVGMKLIISRIEYIHIFVHFIAFSLILHILNLFKYFQLNHSKTHCTFLNFMTDLDYRFFLQSFIALISSFFLVFFTELCKDYFRARRERKKSKIK